MTEEQKKTIATFRFGVICELVNSARLSPGEQARLIREKCTRKWQIPYCREDPHQPRYHLALGAPLSLNQWEAGVVIPAGSQRAGCSMKRPLSA